MTYDRIKLPYLDEKGLDGQRKYNYQQWIDRYKQCTKRKDKIDIGLLIKDKNMPGTDEWNNKQEKIQQDFLWALGHKATHQIIRSEYRTDPDNIKIDKPIKLYNRCYSSKRNKYNSRGDFFVQNKQIRRHRKTTARNYSN